MARKARQKRPFCRAGAGNSLRPGRQDLPAPGDARAGKGVRRTRGAWFNERMPLDPLPRCALVLAAGLAAAAACGAGQPAEPVREAVSGFLRDEAGGLPGRVDIEVGELDPRNQLPECARLQAFLPAASRAWGQTTVGVRCESPATWTIYVPARVRVHGEYLVLARPLRAGQIVGPEDLERRSGDLADDGDGALVDATQAIGHPARFAVAAGQPLRRDMLRLPPVVRRGDPVRVVSRGPGFAVANAGKALNNAAAGHVVRVRLDSGKVLSGIARHDGTVEIER